MGHRVDEGAAQLGGLVSDERIDSAIQRAMDMGITGLQVAAYVDGKPLVDSWAGETGRNEAKVDRDSLFPVHSVTKAFAATCLHIQAERGLVEYDAPVANYWPEFAAHGKGNIAVRHVLSHRSGVPLPLDLTYEQTADWSWMANALADSSPIFPPGEKSMYQALSFGFLVGEIVRRTDPLARIPSQFIRDEISKPLGIEDDVWLVLPPEQKHRIVRLFGGALEQRVRGRLTPYSHPESWSESFFRVRRPYAENPSASGVMTAHAVARFFGLLANGGELAGVRLLSENRVRNFPTPREVKYEYDEALGFIPMVGQFGYWVGDATEAAVPVIGQGPNVICHPGVGGFIGWADLDRGLGAAICINTLIPSHPPPPPAAHPLTAIGEALRAIAEEIRAAPRT
jgi:CubicO group peptidase (beta-lactamase class C family)